MIAFLILLLHVLVSPFKTRARLEAEIVLLRHQLSVLRQRRPGPFIYGIDLGLRHARSPGWRRKSSAFAAPVP